MLASLLSSLSSGELLIRMGSTAFVVIALSLAVSHFGPLIGGALSGLPMVLGPGFFFLIGRATPEFVAGAATYSIVSLCATCSFLLAYSAVATRRGAVAALSAATAGWFATVLVLGPLSMSPLVGAAVFVALALLARWVNGRLLQDIKPAKRREGLVLLLIRGGLAGLLVAVVTTLARNVGPQWSGVFMAYPVGFSVIMVTIHRDLGSATLIATVHSAILGVASLVGFCATVALAVQAMRPSLAFALALAVSVLITIALVGHAYVRRHYARGLDSVS